MSLLVLAESDLRLHADGTAVVVERAGRPVHAVPVHEVTEVHLYGGADLSVGARNLLLARGVDVLLLTLDGRYRGRLIGAESAWSARRVAQYRMQGEPERLLAVGRSIVAAKIDAQRSLLVQRQRHLRSERVAGAASAMRSAAGRLGAASDLDAVRGVEGLAARRYFEVWGELVRNDAFAWNGRNRRPPKDPINAALSFGYTLLVLRTETAVRRAGLDPHLGALHGGSRGAPAVALDLAEPYRALVDALVLTLLNRREVTPDDFDRPPAQKGDDPMPDDAVYLGKIGREIFLRAWHRARMTLRPWPGDGPERTLDQALDEDAHRLRRFAERQAETFTPVAADGSHTTPTDEDP